MEVNTIDIPITPVSGTNNTTAPYDGCHVVIKDRIGWFVVAIKSASAINHNGILKVAELPSDIHIKYTVASVGGIGSYGVTPAVMFLNANYEFMVSNQSGNNIASGGYINGCVFFELE